MAIALTLSLAIAPYPVTQFSAVRSAWRASDAWLLDRHGEPLSRVRLNHDTRRGEWLRAADVSPALTAFVLASEDKRFHDHHGVDWKAVPAALRQTLAGERRGGSTLTMQLAAYLHPQLGKSGRRSLMAKWRQVRQALAIGRVWSKDQILEAWLNLTPFRGELEGIDAASRSLFSKRAAGLDRVEGAMLAALVRSPNAAASRVARRACNLLQRGIDAAFINSGSARGRSAYESECFAAQGLAAGGLRSGRMDRDLDGIAPHLARRLIEAPGSNVTSTIDARLQRFAAGTLTRHLRELEGRHVEDGALVVLDNATGEVLAWVGSSGAISRAHEVDGVVSPRQAGSTLKPFLYALAIEQTVLTAASILDDSPLAVTLPTGLYVPQNYDHAFRGRVSLRQALAASLNVPAVRTLALLGYEPFYRRLKAVGIDLPRDADHYGYSLALGSADVTLLQLTNAYRALANGGQVGSVTTTAPVGRGTTPTLTLPLMEEEQKTLRPVIGREQETLLPAMAKEQETLLPLVGKEQETLIPPTGRKQETLLPPQGEGRDGGGGGSAHAIDPRAAFIVSDILADAGARAMTFGLASPLTTRYRASVKTGTSKDMRDNWAVGYSTRYTVGVWVGNFSGAPMHDVSGIDGAAPVWREVMDYLHDGTIPPPPALPEGLSRQRIAYTGNVEPAREEWFIAGTQREQIASITARAVRPRIETPAAGSIYAIDPDIPRDRQRLSVTTRGAPRGARLVFEDGREARADRPMLWLPEPGQREVVLRARDGRELDRVRFEVRGLRPIRKQTSFAP